MGFKSNDILVLKIVYILSLFCNGQFGFFLYFITKDVPCVLIKLLSDSDIFVVINYTYLPFYIVIVKHDACSIS